LPWAGHALHSLHSALAALLEHLLTLRGRGVVPLLPQGIALVGGQLLELPEVLAHGSPLLRSQGLKLLPALA